jgi:hypothetical protein
MTGPSKQCASRIAFLVLLLATLARADGGKTEKSGPLQGHVQSLPETGKLKDRLLFIDGRQAIVREGRFFSKKTGARYDAWLVDKAEHVVTIYQGLTRRDPLLWIPGNGTSSPAPHKATVHGILRGDFPFPVESGRGLNLYFFAEEASGYWQAQPLEWGHGTSAGPRFGRIHVAWAGERSIAGQLFALGEIAEEKMRWSGAWLAQAPLRLSDGTEGFSEMTMEALPIGHIAGSVSIDGKDVVREIGFYYQLPGKRGRLALGSCPVLNTYDCHLPDLGSLGGEYCAHINYQFPLRYDANGTTTRCGGKLGMTDFSFHVGPKPEWTGASDHMNPQSTLTWKDQGKGIYRVHLTPGYDSKVKGPTIDIYTARTGVRWPDLNAWGMDFPAGATYKCEVTRLSPHASVDELTSLRGFDKDSDYEEAEASTLELSMVKS